jgi:hypothetical protein
VPSTRCYLITFNQVLFSSQPTIHAQAMMLAIVIMSPGDVARGEFVPISPAPVWALLSFDMALICSYGFAAAFLVTPEKEHAA